MLLPEHINFVSMVLCCTCATLVNLAILEFCFLTVWSIAFGFFKEILYGLGLDLLFYQYFPGYDLSVCYLILGFLFSYLNKFDILHVEDLEFIIKTNSVPSPCPSRLWKMVMNFLQIASS